MDVEKTYELCTAWANKIFPRTNQEFKEDLIQEAMLILLESEKSLGYTRMAKHAVIDGARNLLGDSRNLHEKPKMVNIEWAKKVYTAPYEDEFVFYEWLLSRFKGSGKEVAKLMLAGYEIKEIAKLYGCSIANICQLLNYNAIKEKKKH